MTVQGIMASIWLFFVSLHEFMDLVVLFLPHLTCGP